LIKRETIVSCQRSSSF